MNDCVLRFDAEKAKGTFIQLFCQHQTLNFTYFKFVCILKHLKI